MLASATYVVHASSAWGVARDTRELIFAHIAYAIGHPLHERLAASGEVTGPGPRHVKRFGKPALWTPI